MPGAGEAVVVVGDAEGEADGAVGGDDFEDDAEDAEAGCVGGEARPLDDADEKDGEEEPPEVVGELGADVGLLIWAIMHWLAIVFAEGKGRKEGTKGDLYVRRMDLAGVHSQQARRIRSPCSPSVTFWHRRCRASVPRRRLSGGQTL